MANPRTPAQASFPVPPPVPGWPLVDAKGMATPAFAQFLQLLWAAIQGAGGIIDITTQNIFEESPSFSPDTVAGKQPILAEMPESMAGSVPQDKTWLLAERSYADLYKRVSNAEVLAALGSVSSSKVADIKGTANQVIVSTAAGIYTLSTPQDIATTSTVRFGKVGVGMAPTNILDITDTQIGTAKGSILNGNNGVAAAVFWRAINDAGSAAIIGINSSGFTPAGMDRASGSFVVGTGVGGLSCYTLGAQPIYFGINSVEKMQLDASGNLGIGMTPGTTLDITASGSNAVQNVRLTNANAGNAAAAQGRFSNGTNTADLLMLGASFAAGGMFRSGGGMLRCDGPGGLSILTGAVQPIYFGVNSVEVARFDNSRMTLAEPVQLKAYTVATLPAGAVGDVAYVTDATLPTYLGALVGGGAVKTPVFYNGAAWVSF